MAEYIEYKIIPGHENYECSKCGKFRNSVTKKPLKSFVRKQYQSFTLQLSRNKNVVLHRMLMLTWVDNPENYPQVNHIDGNKLNNDISNLEWCTARHNRVHAVKTGLIKNTTKGRRMHSKLDITQVLTIRKCLNDGMTCKDLKNYFKVSSSLISAIKRNIAWQS